MALLGVTRRAGRWCSLRLSIGLEVVRDPCDSADSRRISTGGGILDGGDSGESLDSGESGRASSSARERSHCFGNVTAVVSGFCRGTSDDAESVAAEKAGASAATDCALSPSSARSGAALCSAVLRPRLERLLKGIFHFFEGCFFTDGNSFAVFESG